MYIVRLILCFVKKLPILGLTRCSHAAATGDRSLHAVAGRDRVRIPEPPRARPPPPPRIHELRSNHDEPCSGDAVPVEGGLGD